jgi:hypothetical protein
MRSFSEKFLFAKKRKEKHRKIFQEQSAAVA